MRSLYLNYYCLYNHREAKHTSAFVKDQVKTELTLTQAHDVVREGN